MKKLILTIMLIAAILSCIACNNEKPAAEPCAHEWVVVYLNDTSKLQTIECRICHEVKTEPITPGDIPSPTPDIAKICMHTSHETISSFSMGLQHNVYRCKDCGNCWEIQSDEITHLVINEWTPEEYESAALTWPES